MVFQAGGRALSDTYKYIKERNEWAWMAMTFSWEAYGRGSSYKDLGFILENLFTVKQMVRVASSKQIIWDIPIQQW